MAPGDAGHDMRVPNEQRDDVTAALDALIEAVGRNAEDETRLVGNLTRLRDARGQGVPVTEALAGEEIPGTMELLGVVLTRLMDTSGVARRALARAMRTEGESIPSIARSFGVTHQRISNILNHPPGAKSVAAGRARAASVGLSPPAGC